MSDAPKKISIDFIKWMDIKEFQDLGLLQEVNRRILHPLGLALTVSTDDESGEVSLFGIQDYRDDSEGMFFAKDEIDKEKIDRVQALALARKVGPRKSVKGYFQLTNSPIRRLRMISYIQDHRWWPESWSAETDKKYGVIPNGS